MLTCHLSLLVGMHFHLVRKNRILRQQVEAGLIPPPPDMLPMGKQLLDSDQLDKMPTRTIGGEQAAQEHRAVRRKASRISNASKIDTSAIHNKQQEDEDDDDEYTCVICLEKLEHGDTVRQLPCEHEYHCECIGKASLTQKQRKWMIDNGTLYRSLVDIQVG